MTLRTIVADPVPPNPNLRPPPPWRGNEQVGYREAERFYPPVGDEALEHVDLDGSAA